ncbi:hypothetical protein LB467_16930 [Salegentibacter sp. JZCK2]|uniref:hypothetical protein n=1 Tax=Salegentibacter tibetensis TaxID=2873600 RepID=UPI001CCB2422|nr:hypothetical protein [Salegentibacter tibetensis]MBZ9731376.1 hypothetical protein [Salegentibacter tibetensis]
MKNNTVTGFKNTRDGVHLKDNRILELVNHGLIKDDFKAYSVANIYKSDINTNTPEFLKPVWGKASRVRYFSFMIFKRAEIFLNYSKFYWNTVWIFIPVFTYSEIQK